MNIRPRRSESGQVFPGEQDQQQLITCRVRASYLLRYSGSVRLVNVIFPSRILSGKVRQPRISVRGERST